MDLFLDYSNIERGRQVFQTKLIHTRCSSAQEFYGVSSQIPEMILVFFFCILTFLKLILINQQNRSSSKLKGTSFSAVYGTSKN